MLRSGFGLNTGSTRLTALNRLMHFSIPRTTTSIEGAPQVPTSTKASDNDSVACLGEPTKDPLSEIKGFPQGLISFSSTSTALLPILGPMMDIIMYVLGLKWQKKKKKAAPKKPAAKKKASSKAVVEELENDVLFCKDYVSVRWKITEEGQVATWQPEEEGRPTLSIVPGKITDVVDDKMCGLVAEEGGKKMVRTKIYKKQMLTCKLFFVVFFP